MKKNKTFSLNWTMFLSILIAVLAGVSAFLQEKQKTKKDKELASANEEIRHLQSQIINEIRGSDSTPKLKAHLSYGRDILILELHNTDTVPVNNLKIIVNDFEYDPQTYIVNKEFAGFHHLDDMQIRERVKPDLIEKIASLESMVIFTCKIPKNNNGIVVNVFINNKGTFERFRVVYEKDEEGNPKVWVIPMQLV